MTVNPDNIPIVHCRPPNQLERIEDAIIAHIGEGVARMVTVESYPGKPEDYDFAGLEAAILTHYRASKYKATDGPSNSSQQRRINFSLVLLSRELRGQLGIYAILEDMRLALQGRKIEGSSPVEIVSDALVKQFQGQWQWEIVIGLNVPAVARNYQHPANLVSQVSNSQKDRFNEQT